MLKYHWIYRSSDRAANPPEEPEEEQNPDEDTEEEVSSGVQGKDKPC